MVKLPLLSKLHNEIDRNVILKMAEEFDDVRVIQRIHDFNFVSDLLCHLAIPDLLLVEFFDGIHLSTFFMFNFLYDAEAAFSKHFEKLEVVDARLVVPAGLHGRSQIHHPLFDGVQFYHRDFKKTKIENKSSL